MEWFEYRARIRFFIPLRSIQNDTWYRNCHSDTERSECGRILRNMDKILPRHHIPPQNDNSILNNNPHRMQLCFAPMDWITNCATRLITSQIFEKYWKKDDSLILRTEFMNVDWFLINPHQVIRHALTTPWQKPILQIYWWKE